MKAIIKTGLLLAASLFTSNDYAQPIYKLWDNSIQGNSRDGNYLELTKISNDKILAACFTTSDSAYDKSKHSFINIGNGEPWIVMLDDLGNKIWDRDFYGSRRPMGLAAFDSNTFVMISDVNLQAGIAGNVTAPLTPGSNGTVCSWIVAFNNNDSIFWNKLFCLGTYGTNSHGVEPIDIKVVDGSIYILAYTNRNADVMTGGDFTAINCVTSSNNFSIDILLYKVNPNDSLTNNWQHDYGGDTAEFPVYLHPLFDNNNFYGFIIGGFTSSQASCNQTVSSHTLPYYDYYIIRTDTGGTIIWQQRYGGSKDDRLNGILDAGDGNFLLYGRTNSPMSYDITSSGYNDTSIWIVKINSTGGIIWDKRFGACNGFSIVGNEGGPLVSADFGSNTVAGINTSDGGYLFVSNVTNKQPCGDVSETGQGYEDYWLLKLDSAGKKVWDKRFGGPGFDVAERVVEMRPGYYVVGGYTRGINTTTNDAGGDKSEVTIGNMDLWFLGVVDSAAVIASTQENLQQINFNIYPNPVMDELSISIKNKIKSSYNLIIVDITGKIVLKQRINADAKINIGSLAKGIYIVEVRDSKEFASRKKLVKEK